VPKLDEVKTKVKDDLVKGRAIEAARQKAAAPGRRGLASTLLTGPAGVQAPAPVAYKTLLGQ